MEFNTQQSDSIDGDGTDKARGTLSRRTALGRFAIVGMGTVAASTLLAACDDSKRLVGFGRRHADHRRPTQAGYRCDEGCQQEAARLAAVQRPRRLRGCEARTGRTPRHADDQGCRWQRHLGLGGVQEVHRRRQAGAGHRQSQSVAQRAAEHALRTVRGCARTHLPGARLRPVECHVHQGRYRMDRGRYGDLTRNR